MCATRTEPEEVHLDVAPHRWRVLKSGSGPVALCLHGAGGSADSFRPLMEHLASDLTMIAPDLPGHDQTRLGTRLRSGLQEMAQDVGLLMRAMNVTPEWMIGHSAGAAIALAMDTDLSPRGHILINPALGSFEGIAGSVFPAMAKGLSMAPFAAELLSRTFSNEKKIRELVAATGTAPTVDIMERYRKLVQSPDHIRGTLRMMAAWDLTPLMDRLSEITTPVLLIAGDNDKTVPNSVSKQANTMLIRSNLVIRGGGHLIHEEAPGVVADDIQKFATDLPTNSP